MLFHNLAKSLRVCSISILSLNPCSIFTIFLISDSFPFAATIIMDKGKNTSKGYGSMTFSTEEEAQKDLTEMNGKVKLHHFLWFTMLKLLSLSITQYILAVTRWTSPFCGQCKTQQTLQYWCATCATKNSRGSQLLCHVLC